jgi:ubiquinol-cytochrome c reductase cytochrome b subunit
VTTDVHRWRPGSSTPKRCTRYSARTLRFLDDRLSLARVTRRALNRVFPDHWPFMLGEIALYSFIVLLITGTYLTFFFDPSMASTVYHGRYVPMDGVTMSRA